jgi:hypothetical protein
MLRKYSEPHELHKMCEIIETGSSPYRGGKDDVAYIQPLNANPSFKDFRGY